MAGVSGIEFDAEQRALIAHRLRDYFRESHDLALGQFDAEFLLDFLTEDIGPHFYNRGVLDAQTILASQTDTLVEAMDLLLRPLPRR